MEISADRNIQGSAFAIGDQSKATVVNVYIRDKQALTLRPGRLSYRLPRLPERYQPRPKDFDPLRASLADRDTRAIGIVGAGTTGLLGMGGIGKTVLATALANDEFVRAVFPKGVIWLTFGRDAEIRVKQDELVLAMTGISQPSRDLHEANGILRLLAEALREPLLVVLDDVWDIDEAQVAFAGLGSNLRLLVTTRDRRVLEALGAEPREVGLLDRNEALNFLASAVGCGRSELPPESGEVIRRCGRLPLALAIAGALIRKRVYDWTEVLEALREARLREFPVRWLGDKKQTDLAAVLRVSLDALSNEARACLLDFAVLREDAFVPKHAIAGLWSSQTGAKRRAHALAQELADRSVLQRDADRYSIHDLYRDFLRDICGPLAERHASIVQRYHLACQGDWSRGPNDGYFFQNLPWHLVQCDSQDEAQRLLFDPNWLEAKIRTAGIGEVLADYRLGPSDHEFGKVAAALRLSAVSLTTSATSLRTQLCGRLTRQDGPRIAGMLTASRSGLSADWMIPVTDGYLDGPGQLIRILRGHHGFVNAIAVDRDGRRAASASEDGSVILWNLDTGAPIRDFGPHERGVNTVAFAEEARRLLSGSDDGTLKIWDLDTFDLKATLPCPDGPVDLLVVLPDGWRAVSASSKGGLQVWDLVKSEFLGSFRRSAAAITCLFGIGDGGVLAGDADGGVTLWDPLTRKPVRTFEGHTGLVRAVMLLSDASTVLACADDGTALSWSADSGRLLGRFSEIPIDSKAVALLPGRNAAISGTKDGKLHIWSFVDGQLHDTVQAHSDVVSAVAPLPDRVHVLTGSFDETLRLWDLWAPQARRSLYACGSGICSVALGSNNSAALSGSEDGVVRLWDLEAGTVLKELSGHDGTVQGLALLTDGERAVSGGGDGMICVWNLRLDKPIQRFSAGLGLVNKLVMIDDTRILVGGGNGSLAIWDLEAKRLMVSNDRHRASVSALAVMPDKVHALSGSSDTELRFWDLEAGRTSRILRGHKSTIHAVAAMAGGSALLSASADGDLRLWDIETDEPPRIFGAERLDRGSLRGNALSPAIFDLLPVGGSDSVVLCCGDNRLRLWDLVSDQERWRFQDDHLVSAIAASPDGSHLLAGNQIGRLHLFKFQ